MGFEPKYGDPDNTLLFKIASLLQSQTAGDVSSFNGRSGAVTLISGDVTGALGFTPANVTALSAYVLKAGDNMTGALTFATNKISLNVDGSASFATGVLAITAAGAFSIATNKVQLNVDGTSVFAGFMTCPFYLCEFPDASTNTAPVVSEFEHQLTAGTAAANFGVSIDYTGNSTTTARQIMARFTARWTDATHATRTGQIRIFVPASATLTEVLRLNSTSILIPAGSLLFTDNSFDIGAVGATRPRTGYFGTSVVSPAFIVDSGNVNAQVGTSYTLVATDNGKVVTLSNAGAITLTVPAGLGAGFSCTLIQIGAGQVTVAASGTTVNSYNSLVKLTGQHAAATLYAYVANTFNLSGNLTA